MKLAISATNPCHLWPLARELAHTGHLAAYFSGYPTGRLPGAHDVPVRSHPLRTLVVYGLLRYVPESLRPANRSLFLWQDHAFDRWVARSLEPGLADAIHALPGQALHTFQRARSLGITTVLNHATGPAHLLNEAVRPEYDRLNLTLEDHSAFDADYLEREREEYALADFHCVASTVVRDQLVSQGIPEDKVWTVPYGADPDPWHPPTSPKTPRPPSPDHPFRILFAGQLALRKGFRFLLGALEKAGDPPWRLDAYGPLLNETKLDRANYHGAVPVHYHGPVPAKTLADAMRDADVLVLPSLEEGFGLVVLQALACGTPCIVSEAVGAKDLLAGHPGRGSVVPSRDPDALLDALRHHATTTGTTHHFGSFAWSDAATILVDRSTTLGPATARPTPGLK